MRLEYWRFCGLGFAFGSSAQLMYTVFFTYKVTVLRQMWRQLLPGSTFCALCSDELLVCPCASIEASLDRKFNAWLGLHGWIAKRLHEYPSPAVPIMLLLVRLV
jgi:hypothetical protein